MPKHNYAHHPQGRSNTLNVYCCAYQTNGHYPVTTFGCVILPILKKGYVRHDYGVLYVGAPSSAVHAELLAVKASLGSIISYRLTRWPLKVITSSQTVYRMLTFGGKPASSAEAATIDDIARLSKRCVSVCYKPVNRANNPAESYARQAYYDHRSMGV